MSTSSREVLGTGLSGLVGSRVVELNPEYNFSDLSLDTGIDILNSGQLETAFKMFSGDTVLHLAAFTDTNAAWDQKGDKTGLCYQLNVIGTQNIVDLCKKYNKHLVYISTDFVFNGAKEGKYTEKDSPTPIEWYGQTKFDAEKIAASIDATIIRIAFPYRANFDTKIDLVRKIISKLSQNQTCKLFDDQITTPTLVDDVALGLKKVIDDPRPGIYHLVGSSSQSVYQMGKLIAEVFGYDQNLIQPSSLVEYLKTPNARPYAPNLAISNEKFVSEFGFRPRTLTQGLEVLKQQLFSPPSPRN